MTALQIVKGNAGSTAAPQPWAETRATVDLIVDGMNLTGRMPDAELAPLLRDLAVAVAGLASLENRRATIRCYSSEGPWELGLERSADQVLLSLFRGGTHPEIAFFEREVDLPALIGAILSAIGRLEGAAASGGARAELDHACSLLLAARVVSPTKQQAVTLVEVEPEGEADIRICAELALRERQRPASHDSTVERADLFSLLVRGTLRIGIGEHTRQFPDTFVYLFAEQLLALAGETLDAWEQGRSYYRRLDLFGVVLGIRVKSDGDSEGGPGLWFTVAGPRPRSQGEARTFRLTDAPAFVEASVNFGRTLVRALLRHDPAERQNLRVTNFRRALRSLDERLREATCEDTKVNPSPEIYRAFAAPVATTPSDPREASKLRYSAGWTASFPGIDLRATFLCGDHVVVGGSRETACVSRRTGDLLWRRATQPAVSVVTPLGLARLFADGSIALHDFGSGDIVLTCQVAPRIGGIVTGAIVSSPGLPRMLVVSEGKRHLSAVDLRSGEVRWRHTAHGGSMFRLRRAGKLLVVVAGDATLSAVDLGSGEIVWRTRDRLRFAAHVGLDHDSLFAVAGEPDGKGRGAVRLHHLDPYAGTTRWVRELSGGPSPLGAPLVTDHEVVVVTRDRRGLGLLALDRATGATLWSSEPGLFPTASAWLAIDESIIVNSAAGDLFSLATHSGDTRWRHRFPRGMEGDQPRRLEPILRSGALFVPQQQVHLVRPRDGAILGHVPTELIPDLLRVDERCDVYVAEESGHLASFRAGPKLSLV